MGAMDRAVIRQLLQLTDACDIEPDIGGQEKVIADPHWRRRILAEHGRALRDPAIPVCCVYLGRRAYWKADPPKRRKRMNRQTA
jgi:hypothetical protein